ncbi:hypothetical protein Tco_0894552 [Tanacetum coccineum]|uniref:Uncharacterized protein n=1 Tax=Tanacetum coccineum TaxID=301880 RepID=A0ABQ5CC42_9ASTR
MLQPSVSLYLPVLFIGMSKARQNDKSEGVELLGGKRSYGGDSHMYTLPELLDVASRRICCFHVSTFVHLVVSGNSNEIASAICSCLPPLILPPTKLSRFQKILLVLSRIFSCNSFFEDLGAAVFVD